MTIDLTTNYGGLVLRSPVVVGACPLMAEDSIRIAVETAGAGAIVLPSLFNEHVTIRNQRGAAHQIEAAESKIDTTVGEPIWHDAEAYLSFVNRASTHSTIPIIASLNGHTAGRWVDYADELEEAGAAGIELSIHHGPVREYDDPRAIEQLIIDAVREINASISIPLFVKLSHQYTSISHLARELQSGTQGMVLFGRRPNVDISLDDLSLKTQWDLTPAGSITGSLDTIMQVHSHCPSMPLAASGGIGSAADVIKALVAGADVAMVTSAIYRDGPNVIRLLVDGLRQFMTSHQIMSIYQLQMNRPLEFATEEERDHYIRALSARLNADKVPGKVPSSDPSCGGDCWGHSHLA